MKNYRTPRSVDERLGRGYSRPPLARMLRIHEWLMGNRYPNCRKIAEEFEVSAKTVQRDVNFMRDQMGLPIEYNKARFGFHYTRAVTGFPAVGKARWKAEGKGKPLPKPQPPPLGDMPSLTPAAGRETTVHIHFDAESAKLARGRTWHPTQVIRPLPDGGVEMTLRPRDEWEVALWILSWGAHAWVSEPPRMRSRVREIARAILARH